MSDEIVDIRRRFRILERALLKIVAGADDPVITAQDALDDALLDELKSPYV